MSVYLPFQEIYKYSQTVQRKIPGHIRAIQVMLYIAVAFFTYMGALMGFLWGLLAVGTLIGTWWVVGQARVTYIYRIVDKKFYVDRYSGFKTRQKKQIQFLDVDLSRIIVVAPEGSPALEDADAKSEKLVPKRITYDVSAHDPDHPCTVMFIEGCGEEEGRTLRVFFQPSGEFKRYLRQVAGTRAFEDDDETAFQAEALDTLSGDTSDDGFAKEEITE